MSPSALALALIFCVDVAAGARRRNGDGGGSKELSIENTVAFTILIVVALVLMPLTYRAVLRLRKQTTPPGFPPVPLEVGKLFPIFLVVFCFTHLTDITLYAIFIALQYDLKNPHVVSDGYVAVRHLASQASDILLLSTILSVITTRNRIQLHPKTSSEFTLKTFLDGWLLSTTFILGATADILTVALPFDKRYIFIRDFTCAYTAFYLVAILDVILSSIGIYIRLQNSGIQDSIVQTVVKYVAPLLGARGIYAIIWIGLVYSDASYHPGRLVLSGVIIINLIVLSIVILALGMGAPPGISERDASSERFERSYRNKRPQSEAVLERLLVR